MSSATSGATPSSRSPRPSSAGPTRQPGRPLRRALGAVRRGEVWWALLPDPWGRRPVLLLARDEAYRVLTWVAVAPLTTTIRDVPSAVRLDPATDGVPRPCAVSLDNLQAIRKDWLDEPIARLRPERMAEVERALRFALGMLS